MALTAQAAIQELINNPAKYSDPNALRSLTNQASSLDEAQRNPGSGE